jgi:tetratricopeptide (TPR) repeat protein
MSDALYERYKDALRRGHVAAARTRYDAALEAYGEASRLAPDRALPLIGVAGVLVRMGRGADAIAAYDAALDRSPADEAALRGRSDLLIEAGDRIGAAETLDRLALALDTPDRLVDAADAACRALELAESRGRRETVRSLADRLRSVSSDPIVERQLDRASRLLDGPLVGPGEAAPEAPFAPGAATAEVEEAAEGDDPEVTRRLALAASAGHRAAGNGVAAIDACYLALASNPADPALHLALAELYLDRGWDRTASDKLRLLARHARLTGDADATAQVCALAAARLSGDEGLASLCA